MNRYRGRPETIMIIENEEFVDFLAFSKRERLSTADEWTYLPNGSAVHSNHVRPWLYVDMRSGDTVMRGTEDVYCDLRLVWSMQYRGGLLGDVRCDRRFIDIAEVVDAFLRLALEQMPTGLTARGPRRFEFKGGDHSPSETLTPHEEFVTEELLAGKFVYVNSWTGDLESFLGREEIYRRGELVYYYDFIGGVVLDRHELVVVL